MSLREWWRAKRRLARPPADSLAVLATGERVVSWGFGADESVILATQRGLWLPATPAGPARRIEWSRINKAAWSGGALTIVEARELAPGEMVDAAPVVIALPEPRDLPPTVRRRVDQSVAYTVHHPLPPRGGVRVVARRVSGVDGLEWMVRYDEGTDTGDPRVMELAETMLADARIAIGMDAD